MNTMKNFLILVVAVSFLTLCSTISRSVDYSGVASPLGPSTVPPSSISSGLVSTPDPIDTTGNLLITGNVRSGRHFRGTVPYRSTTSFGSTLGSSSLSSFLRDSAGSEDFGTYSNIYRTQPYYPPAETVATTVPGRAGVFSPTGTRIGNRAQDVFGLEPLPTQQTSSGQGTIATDLGSQAIQTPYSTLADLGEPSGIGSRAMSPSPRPSGTGIRQQSEQSAAERFREQTESLRAVLDLEPGQNLPDLSQPGKRQEDDSIELFRQGQVSDKTQDVDFEALRRDKGEFKTHKPAESTTATEQGAAGPYRLPGLEDYRSSTDTASQESIILQRRLDGSAASEESQADQQRASLGALEIVERYRGDTAREPSAASSLAGVGQRQGQRDVLEQIRQQLENLTASIETRLQVGPDDTLKGQSTEMLTQREKNPLTSQQYTPDSGMALSLEEFQGGDPGFGADELGPDADGKEPALPGGVEPGLTPDGYGAAGYESPPKKSSPLDELNELSQAELSAQAKRVLGRYTSLESFSKARFNQYMLAAEDHLKAGRYYRAADSFTLASIYEPDNPQVLAGRGHALFAAGEYVSSALFLARALAIAPEYARTNIDLTTISGGQSKLTGRIADVEQWLARSGSNQLRFLLSYLYYRTGRLSQAKQTIDAAYETMPQSLAVQALRTSIDDAMQNR